MNWHNIEKEGNPKVSGRYKVRAINGWVGELYYEKKDDYWSTMGYQSDIKDWAEKDESE